MSPDPTPDPALDLDLERAVEVALQCAARAIEITRATPLGEIRTKRHAADVVTDVDTTVERAVRTIVAEAFPAHDFVGEEYGGSSDAGPAWYCDPVDGTSNLAAGLPWTAFSLSLAIGDRPIVGVVADPWRGDVWHAREGQPAMISGVPVGLGDSVGQLTGTVIGTELTGYRSWPGMARFFAELASRHCTVRIMGSSTLTLAQVAAGRTAGGVISEFHPEDHLAAAFIARQTGLAVWDETGKLNVFPASGGLMVARTEVADELFSVWQAARSGLV